MKGREQWELSSVPMVDVAQKDVIYCNKFVCGFCHIAVRPEHIIVASLSIIPFYHSYYLLNTPYLITPNVF